MSIAIGRVRRGRARDKSGVAPAVPAERSAGEALDAALAAFVAEVVALARELRAQRVSLRKISVELARNGYLTANGRPYVATAVQATLAG